MLPLHLFVPCQALGGRLKANVQTVASLLSKATFVSPHPPPQPCARESFIHSASRERLKPRVSVYRKYFKQIVILVAKSFPRNATEIYDHIHGKEVQALQKAATQDHVYPDCQTCSEPAMIMTEKTAHRSLCISNGAHAVSLHTVSFP